MSFTVYSSSAGSGKTYTLVKEYLKIILSDKMPNKYKEVLAITFTNKAADEMKERVMKALTDLSVPAHQSTLKQQLIEEINIDEYTISQRSRNILEHILHHYADFNISTIDKFVHKIIKTFAFDLKLPLHFEVELDTDLLLKKAVDALISKVGVDDKITKILTNYTIEKADEEANWQVDKDIEVFAANLMKESSFAYVEKLKEFNLDDFYAIRKQILSYIHDFENEVETLGKNTLDFIDKKAIQSSSFAGGERSGLYKYFSYFRDKRMDKLIPSNTVQNNMNSDKWVSGKCPASQQHAIEENKSFLLQQYQEMQQLCENKLQQYSFYVLINKHIYALALLNELSKVMEEFKNENQTIHISEFNKKIAQIVMNESAPFIYERIGERYTNYLIDEFQDTSELQWQNLLPLIDNSLGYGHFNMIVGDGKQSIYRWRGGEVEQFARLPMLPEKFKNNPIIAQREASLVRNINRQVLNSNYRSKCEIVDFNNRFFTAIKDLVDENYSSIYQDVIQKYDSNNVGGYVHVDCIVDAEDSAGYTDENLTLILNKIEESLADGYQLHDITILCRKNSEGVTIAKYLVENGIDVVSSESLLVANSKEVNLLLAAIKYLLNAQNMEPKLTLLQHVINVKNLQVGHVQMNELLHKDVLFKSFIENHLPDLNKDKLARLALFELIMELIRIFDLDYNNDLYINTFVEFVAHFNKRQDGGITEMLEDFERKKKNLSIPLSAKEGAVNIMTIHKSKGLQFPVVIFPFANWKTSLNFKTHWIELKNNEIPNLQTAIVSHKKDLMDTPYADVYIEEECKNMLDNFNILYVAFTRPQDRLYIITSEHKNYDFSKTFLPILKNMPEWNGDRLIIGQLAKNHRKKDNTFSNEKVIDNHKLNTNFSWRQKIKVATNVNKFWDLESGNLQVEFGNLLHQLLSFIKTKHDKKEAFEKFLRLNQANDELCKGVIAVCNNLLENKEILTFFDVNTKQVYNEKELITPQGDILRPDRLIVDNKHVKIIDFKTGLERNSYHQQLNEYGDVLKEMGFEKIEKFIVYTESLTVEKL
jgi:ATP-dependent exoDNAse (exonuclease V) beta subunit